MLVLTRRTGEKLVVGNEIVIEVLSVSGDVVRLGINAPRETSVHRHEIFVQIQEANRAAQEAAAATEIGESAMENIVARLKSGSRPERDEDEK
jgi:carbon storage regulator